jgi:RecA-family ATPase
VNSDEDWLAGVTPIDRVRGVLRGAEDIDPPPNLRSGFEIESRNGTFTEPPPAPPIATFHRLPNLADRQIPPRAWLVPDLIPFDTVTLLTGDGATGKSLIAAQLAAATCLGSSWMGRAVARGGAVYVSAEDDETELLRRLADIAKAEDVTFADLDRLTITSLAGKSALLATLERNGSLRATKLMAEIEAVLETDRPTLLVLDTLADLFPGNENDRAQARQFIGMMRGLAIRYEAAVVLLSHPSVEGMRSGSGTSGSTAWSNSVRSRLYFDRIKSDGFESDPDARVLRCLKSNYSRAGAEIKARWREGVFVPDGPETGLDRGAASARAERVFMRLLRLFDEQGRRVSHRRGPSYAPKEFADHPDSEGVTKRAFQDVMERLLSASKIAVIEAGPPSKRVHYLREVAG